jgi:hypothetical protein
MANFVQKGDKAVYSFVDQVCLGRACWAPGHFQHRGATMSGSRSTGASSATCMRRAYHGCPNDDDRPYDVALAKKRKAEGWKRKF